MRNFGDDPKIRLLNRLYEKKRRVRAQAPTLQAAVQAVL